VVYKAVGDSMITDHQIVPANKVKADGRVADNDVKITTFENGAKVYVNYSDSKVVVDNVEIGAKDFKVVGGAEA
ncbi:MAG: hypothetical protein IJN82_05275, partial [Clostridia bacterium]|nr:hypothetical protein [Clostridia bacterium]